MARTLSDTVIIAMIESATRLASGRGPIAGSVLSQVTQGAATPPAAGEGGAGGEGAAGGSGSTVPAPAASDTNPTPKPDGSPAADRDARTAEQIAADFRTIYQQIEEVVRTSAEQETKTVGFGVR
ncbi:MAG: hypothetical protein ACRDI2_06745 [Chloroflexota bacterium]